MKIHVYFTLNRVTEDQLRGKRVVVIDVLRTCTTIATAIANGGREIIPAESIEAATLLATDIDRKSVFLCGEREGKRIDGFDLGNSPREYKEKIVKEKNIVFVSSNGSVALVKSRFSAITVVCAFVNVSTVVDYLLQEKGDIHILCAGNQGRFSLEDAVCSGMLLQGLQMKGENNFELNDSAVAAEVLLRKYEKRIKALLRNCDHGRYLTGIGFSKDLLVCAEVNSLRIVPVMRDGRITKAKVHQPHM
ncbi:MAG: 2-phosphosulfolactate phosphatase [Gemmatimonadota bacterium]|nr:MAG: 2-phosphosulfolactate phosphatase [Gemmatimonadota bacterium]